MFKQLPLFALMAASVTEAHFGFTILTKDVAGVSTPQGGNFEFIRLGTQQNSTLAIYTPITDITSPDMRCNKGGEAAGTTKTFEAAAGDTLGFKVRGNEKITNEPGPVMVYMSKAPAAVSAYDGSGDWFKIHEESTVDASLIPQPEAWATEGKQEVKFVIPKDVPAGEYLVRIEQISLEDVPKAPAEHYISCAQIKVTSTGTGKPEPLVKIPGLYKADDAGLTFNLFSAATKKDSYVVPGPKVWPPVTPAKSKSKRWTA